MRRKTIGWVILVVVCIIAIYAYCEYTRTTTPTAQLESAYKVSADVLVAEFEKDDSSANKKYLGKILTVSGFLKQYDKGSNMIILGDISSTSSVRCSMDSAAISHAMQPPLNSKITVKGNCTGFNKDELLGSDVILNRAIILRSKAD